MTKKGTRVGASAAALDASIGLTRAEDDGEWTVLRLDPTDNAVAATEPVAYLHGGAIATCVDTASWEAITRAHDGDWVVADMRIDFVRLARPESHRVRAIPRKVGRRQAVVDVEISAWDDADRVVALGRVLVTNL
ncbi:MAG TPA: PaaI family thioesterase [Actinomycetes bacterium]|nr:PaaI family thioesterase [Actinomycetes bacterium]